jgi:hypothetical protein
LSSVIVPTVERDVRTGLVWSIAIAGDRIDLRLVHAIEELARVGRKRLDVAPLALGIQRVEHEGRLAAARHARHDDEFAGGKREIQVLEIVLARAANNDGLARRLVR